MTTRLLAGSIALSMLTAPTLMAREAWADPSKDEVNYAKELYVRGEQEEDARSWASALDKFKRVGGIKMTAAVRYHIAFCEENLGRLQEALIGYDEAEQMLGAADNGDAVRKAVVDARTALLRRAPTIMFTGVDTLPSSAHVLIDGKQIPAARWAMPQLVSAGSHVVEANAEGQVAFHETVNAAPQREIRVAIKLETSKQAPTIATSTPTEEAPPKRGGRGLAIGATIGSVVLLGAGVGAFFVAGSKASDAETECKTQPSCDPQRGSIRTFDTLALGGFIGGAALGVVAVLLWAKPTTTSNSAQTRRFRLGLAGAGMRLQGEF